MSTVPTMYLRIEHSNSLVYRYTPAPTTTTRLGLVQVWFSSDFGLVQVWFMLGSSLLIGDSRCSLASSRSSSSSRANDLLPRSVSCRSPLVNENTLLLLSTHISTTSASTISTTTTRSERIHGLRQSCSLN